MITSSGVLVTLLFGLVSLVADAEAYQLPPLATVPMLAALVFFSLAIISAISVYMPPSEYNIPASVFTEHVENNWHEAGEAAMIGLAKASADLLEGAQATNAVKAHRLRSTLVLQVFAVVSLAVVVGLIAASSLLDGLATLEGILIGIT